MLALFAVGCSSSPTSPTAPSTPPVVVVPPVVTPPVTPANPLLSDPRFSLDFYRMFALGTLEYGRQPLQRLTQAPQVYLRTMFDDGTPVDATTLDSTAAAIINTAAVWTGGAFGLAGLERGTGTRELQPGWITVYWMVERDTGRCGNASTQRGVLRIYPNTPNCSCGTLKVRPLVVKHELGHAMGFYHTDSAVDIMYGSSHGACDMEPSAREVFHARVAYSQPLGSLDPS